MTLRLDPPTIALREPVDDGTRRELLVAGAGLLALGFTACGDGADGEAGSATRRVRHFYGTTEVPTDPQRVFAGYTQTLANLLELGAPVVGGPEPNIAGDYLGGRLADVESVGKLSAINVEAVAALRPDVLITVGAPDNDFARELYEQLRSIGPTVAPYWEPNTVEQTKRHLLGCGTVVGRERRARELAGALDERIAELGRRLDVTLADRPVSLLRVYADKYMIPVGDISSGVLMALGVQRPAPQTFDPVDFAIELSLERLGELDSAHAIFVYTDRDAGDEGARLEANPLWERLPAVRAGRVYFVEHPGAWAIGADVVGVNLILDEIEQRLA
jgi:iron complex transport system substrate-binding protein